MSMQKMAQKLVNLVGKITSQSVFRFVTRHSQVDVFELKVENCGVY